MEEEDEAGAVEVPLTACLMASAMLEELDPASLWPSNPDFAVRLLCVSCSKIEISEPFLIAVVILFMGKTEVSC